MKFTGERCVLGSSDERLIREHLIRYNFASKYTKNKKVLDVACGSGYGSKLLLDNGAKEVIGVDISKESILYAKEKYQQKELGFFRGDATHLKEFKNESFDVIVSFETIEHLKEYHKYLSEINRLLKKKALFLVSTPNKKFSSPNSKKPLNPFHYIEFNLNDFKKILWIHFDYVEIYGQDLQNLYQKFLKRLGLYLPKKIRYKYNIKKINKYGKQEVGEISDKKVEDCRFFIAICRKNEN